MHKPTVRELLAKVQELTNIGIALSDADDYNSLLEQILTGARKLTNAEAGSLYIVNKETDCLEFVGFHNDKLKLKLGLTNEKEIKINPIPLHHNNGADNLKRIVTRAVLQGETINVEDAYNCPDWDLSGTHAMDEKTGYKSISFLTVPLKDHKGEVLGALQLINRLSPNRNQIVAFSEEDQTIARSLASQAAVTMTMRCLLEKQKDLFRDSTKMIAQAIDTKSRYTMAHCSRVPIIANMLARAVNKDNSGPLKKRSLTEQEIYELDIASWLHDCGKLGTPDVVMDKATKQEGRYDRIDDILARFEIIKRDLELENVRAQLSGDDERIAAVKIDVDKKLTQMKLDMEMLAEINKGGETLDDEVIERLRNIIANYKYQVDDKFINLIRPQEAINFLVERGTLNDEERETMQYHVVLTQKMLGKLTFPEELSNVPEIAGNHHELLDGKGYPHGLTGDTLSLRSRILTIADVFEALTASDRPYKKGKTITESLSILKSMAEKGEICPSLYNTFVEQEVWREYADTYVAEQQKDKVIIKDFLVKAADFPSQLPN